MVVAKDCKRFLPSLLVLGTIAVQLVLFSPAICHALCATVKIEIRQELTLERQAFDAHMRINNGLSNLPLESVGVLVTFADENGDPVVATSNPDDTDARFFIRVDTMENIEDVDGNGTVAPETSADIHWLIIPAPGASNGLESGTLYFVGASLTYTAAGQEETIEVTPDYIYVKPMPQLVLDYFLPTDVYGDDAWSSEVEAPVPFSLGLRVSNKGAGAARDLKIESAQPQIVENELGLLIGFQLQGTQVNGSPATNSLLADFGDIAPNSAGMARWIMTCTLSGRFVEFEADFSHADELGGKLTSLIGEDDVRTHFLVHDVLVDAPGRDTIADFLAKDDDVFRVFESENTETDVTDQSPSTTISPEQGLTYRMTTPVTAGFMFAQVTDPTGGNLVIQEIIRSDGKRLKTANAWQSKTRAGSGPWQYYVNLFDHNTTGSYTVLFQNLATLPQPPVVMYIPERTGVEGQQLSFLIEASDPNGTIPSLFVERLPVGAAFADQGDGSAIFDWTPSPGQAGRYSVKFIASDGTLEASRQAVLIIRSQSDTDGDGMPDDWEMLHFGTLDRDGSGDFDGDGLSDLDEYLNGLDPAQPQSVPSVPELLWPQNGERVTTLMSELEIGNSIDPEGDAFTYTLELYADEQHTDLIAAVQDLPPQVVTTTWTIPETLLDNQTYFWRVKAADATGCSNWNYGRFFVNLENEAPTAPVISYPAAGMAVDRLQPMIEVHNSSDPDLDLLTYRFEVYADSAMSVPIASVADLPADPSGHTTWTLDTQLVDGLWYYWRAVAVDAQGAETPSPLADFQVNTSNGAPDAPVILAPLVGSEATFYSVELSAEEAIDPEADPLTYTFEIDASPRFDGAGKRTSEPVQPMDGGAAWMVENLEDNTVYYWRVRAGDGVADSPWAYGRFRVNILNDEPPTPELKNPGMLAWVNTRTPQFSVHPLSDMDGDTVAYRFELYRDQDLSLPVAYGESETPTWIGGLPLAPGQWYSWRVQAVDQHGLPGPWSEVSQFFVKINGINVPPQLTFVEPPDDLGTNAQGIRLRWIDADPDSSAVIALYYDTDNVGADGILISEDIGEDADGTSDYYTWDVSSLEGDYYVYAVISDGFNTQTVYCPAAMRIDHTPPVATAAPAGGVYGDSVNVALAADEAAQIYYTLDGSEPGLASAVYEAPIAIGQATTLKFMAIDTVGNQSPSSTETYSFEAAAITVTAATDKGRLLSGLRVYAFTEANAYTGLYATTDGLGEAVFDPADFSAGSYRFRVDYLGSQFWSQPTDLPATFAVDVVIPEEPVTVSVVSAAGAAQGVSVYLFSATGAYLGVYLTTDANGQATFELPAGLAFNFRIDMFSNQYWSGLVTVTPGGPVSAPVDTGGGLLRCQVAKDADQPLQGLRVYLFNASGSYLGQYQTSDDNGEAAFNVPAGTYTLRADYLGYQFWSAETGVVTDTAINLEIPHQQIQVQVESSFQGASDPRSGITVYLFSASGAYLGRSQTTDTQGRAAFDLPQTAFKVRADFMGQQYWSGEFTWQDPVVTIPMAEALVSVSGAGVMLQAVPVYVFTAGNSYLGHNTATDADGQALFRLPEGDYRFRADYQGSQFWSADASLAADTLQDIGISTGGGSFTFTVSADSGDPLTGVPCYVFDGDTNAYLGLQGTTATDGQTTFDLSDGDYRLRVDYLGHQFWSDVIQVPDTLAAAMTIDHTPVTVTVLSAAAPAGQVRVYLFNENDSYLGRYLETDAQGQVVFDLPSGVGYRFRADLHGSRYWSDVLTVPSADSAAVTVDAGGGRLQLTLEDGSAAPMEGLPVYLFNASGSYLGQTQSSDAAGQVFFDLSAGTYQCRIDYLGYSFWTDPVEVQGDTAITLPIVHQQVTITVQERFQAADQALAGIRVYLFTPTDTYLGLFQETDANGQAAFILPQRDFKVRADYRSRQYWSETFNGPAATVTIPMAEAQVSVTGAGLPAEGIQVYLFNEAGAYLGLSQTTDAAGQATFRVPEGTYRFRADYQGNQYWSGDQALIADLATPVVVSVGGGTFTLTVQQDADTPMAGIRCYVFNGSGAYLGLLGASDSQGRTRFDLAEGSFLFRVDYLGYQYWSQLVTVPDLLAASVTIAHQDIQVSVSATYLGATEPLAGCPLYLFTPGNAYMGLSQTTDAGGLAVFRLPDQPYKIRADHLGRQYWSPDFQAQDTTVSLSQGAVDLHVHRDNVDAQGVRVYLFNTAGTYLGLYQLTDTDGWTAYILPEGDYRFRVDADGSQTWTADVTVAADQTVQLEVDLNP